LRRYGVPEPGAIFVFFALALGAVALFCWFAVPPALHQIGAALHHHPAGHPGSGVRGRALQWLNVHLRRLPTGTALVHPIATYGHKATDAVVATFFTLAATWYWVSERDRVIELLAALASEPKRDKARATYLAIDERLGAYTRLRFGMVIVIGVVLSA